MPNRENYGPNRSPFRIILYILAVAVLLGGIAYLVFCTREKQSAFQEQIQELNANETEYVPPVKKERTATEAETKKEETTSATDRTSESAATENETETGTESAAQALKEKQILLLNGSGQDGMAAKWKAELAKEGYQNVSIASYPGASIEHTRIYETETEDLKPLQELFQDAETTTEKFTAEVEIQEKDVKPEEIEIYIIIGKADAAK